VRLLEQPEGDDALHAFRVSLRRLRSWLRAWRGPLRGSGVTRARRELGAIAEVTGASRDAEVHLAWLAELEGTLGERERCGARWLAERLAARKADSDATLRAEITKDFPKLRERLARRLATYRATVHVRAPRPETPMAAATAKRVVAHLDDLLAALAGVRTPADEHEGHEARILGKRLRYLLEPLQPYDPEVKGLLQRLKGLQDGLGALHDAQVFSAELARAMEAAATEQARALSDAMFAGEEAITARRRLRRRDPAPGLVALVQALQSRADEAFAGVSRDWLGGAGAPFAEDVRALAARLAARAGADTEVERKYLLRAFPEAARAAPATYIEQGYVPGARVHERLRRTREGDAERWYRTVKLGTGVTRIEIEEETTRELFETMWPLTAGKRVRKWRHRVAHDGKTWEIDRFDDRELVLAELELDHEDEAVAIPDWLAEVLVREVTAEREYANVNLAR
jgi:CHAD domain-containing protein/CYTH domain-containing protein